MQKRIGGAVILDLNIDGQGHVTSARVAVSSGYPEFDQSARETVRHWKFRPAQRDGVAIAFRANQRVVFRP
jgi:periplasmic protein TonB